MEIFALIIACLAFILSLWQFFRGSMREKNESTLIVYNELQNEVFQNLRKYRLEIPRIAKKGKGEEWDEITGYLAKIERFSVGINTGIYSLDILNRLGGMFFIEWFENLKPIINRKENVNESKGKHYNEFEDVAKTLKKYREKSVVAQLLFNIFHF